MVTETSFFSSPPNSQLGITLFGSRRVVVDTKVFFGLFSCFLNKKERYGLKQNKNDLLVLVKNCHVRLYLKEQISNFGLLTTGTAIFLAREPDCAV